MTTRGNHFDPDIMSDNRWTSASQIEGIIIRYVSKFFLWKVSVEELCGQYFDIGPSYGIHFEVVVTLYPWSWLWFGKKQYYYTQCLYRLHSKSNLKFPVHIIVR